ncbi:putative SAC3/GANP domain-containing protein [Neospora caninum Liverpool]|uniref:Putative SAC3/GANP domain-containing protein n=1 Tax=Neospora caninum (strain Liverpool) TaxID=572307 RepID=F0VGQ9_NEOCL|nr:putative SAC3/GANP domain-containing protein [Neospora caninum Liverpool]CBZ52903.1 putative SAC3/GANP domain-containing protein [Neospora caninum Liverpool]CEL66885.1 TPA: SAC3/GANP domain-containing protein, putative [Neospora caninum Liverpool]|eukprot:XP_003882935.1 putative SAC3/GANP domain-containing protein [Neospora caninum Liverpool]
MPGGFAGLWSPQGAGAPANTTAALGNAMANQPAGSSAGVIGPAVDQAAQGPAGALFNSAGGMYMDMDTYLAYAYQQYTNHYYGIARQTAPPEIAMQQARECVEKLKASGFFDLVKTRYQATLAAAATGVSPQGTPAPAPMPDSTAAPSAAAPLPPSSQAPQGSHQQRGSQGRVAFSLKLKTRGGPEGHAAAPPASAASVPSTASSGSASTTTSGGPGLNAAAVSPVPGVPGPAPPGACPPTVGGVADASGPGAGAPWPGAAIPTSSLPSYGAYYQQMVQAQQQAYLHMYQQGQMQPAMPSVQLPSQPSPYASGNPSMSNMYNAPPMYPGGPVTSSPPPPPPPLPAGTVSSFSGGGGGPGPGGHARIESAVEAAAKAAAAAVEAKHRSGQGQPAGAGAFDIASARDQALKRAAEITKDIEERRKQQLLSTQAFSLWLQKVHSTHLMGDKGLEWRRTVNLFSQKMTNDYRLGLLGGRDWATHPVPSEDEIQSEVVKLNFQMSSHERSGKPSLGSDRGTSMTADPYASGTGGGSGRHTRRDSEGVRDSRSRSRSPVYGASSFRHGRNERNAYRHRQSQLSPSNGRRDRDDRPDDARSLSEVDGRGRKGDEDYISLTDKWDRGLGKSRSKARQVQLLRRDGRGERGSAGDERKEAPVMLIKCTPQEEQKRLQRMNRFGPGPSSGSSAPPGKENPLWKVSWTADGSASPSAGSGGGGGLSWQQKLAIAKSTEKIIGTSTALEKNYLRLTNAPDPATVRPPEVLRRSFELILQKHREGASWRYVEEQFRSMRQDLTVQGVKDEFSRKVYETNGRLALSYHDLGQFNQCQTQLRDLYKRLQVAEDDPERLEYLCYRLVYMALQGMRLDVLRVMSEMTAAERSNSNVVYAMKVRRALADGNFRRYFYLASIGPHQTRHLCEIFEPRVRMLALVTLAKASLVLQPKQLQEELNFSDLEETLDFLRREGAVFNADGKLDSKRSLVNFEKSSLLSKKVKAMG